MNNKRRARGEGTIIQRPDGKWQGQISLTENGKRRRLSVTADTKLAAAAKLRTLRAEAEGLRASKVDATVKDAIDNHLRRLDARVKSGSMRATSRDWYVHMLKRAEPLYDKPLRGLRATDIEEWSANLTGSPSARRGAFRALKAAFDTAQRDGMVAGSVFRVVDAPPDGREKEPVVIDAEQLDRLCEAAAPPWSHYWRLLGETGLRRSELLGLTWADVIEERDNAAVFVRKGKTKAARRLIPLTSRARDALNALREIEPSTPDDPVCSHPVRYVNRRFTRDAAAAGLEGLTPHALRHSFVTRLLNNKTPVHVAAGLAGHSRPSITVDVYAHLVSQEARDAMGLMEGGYANEQGQYVLKNYG